MTDISPAPDDRLAIEAGPIADDMVCFALTGEVDPHTAPMLQERIDVVTLAPDGGPGAVTSVVLDMGAVSFVDSAGLRVIADTQRRLGDAGGQLVVRSPSAGLQKLLSVTGLADHVEIET